MAENTFSRLPQELLSFSGRNRIFWRLVMAGTGPMMRLAQWHRATLSRRMRLVAVIGTYGKTTGTRAVKAALGLPPKRWTDLNGNCFSLLPLALMRQWPLSRHGVVEAGIAAPGQMQFYARALRPDVVIVTSIGEEHIQSFKNIEHLRDEKAAMVRGLSPQGTAVLNGDDPHVMWMATQTSARIVTFGLSPGHDVFATDIALDWPEGTRMNLHAFGTSLPLRTHLMGKTMLYPLLAAVAAAAAEGRPLAQIIAGLELLPPTPGRMQAVPLSSGAVILRDEFKATIDTVYAALDMLQQVPAQRRIVAMGDLESPLNPQRFYYNAVGARICAIADRAVFIGHSAKNSRWKPCRSRMGADRVAFTQTWEEALPLLRDQLGPGDVLLVKGAFQQRLTRLAMALAGADVQCHVRECGIHLLFCDICPLLFRRATACCH